MDLWLIILIIILGAIFLFFLLPSFVLYGALMWRSRWTNWKREFGPPRDDEMRRTYEEAEQWIARYEDKISEARIKNGRFRLAGQYVDFGFTRAVIIISGRTEACRYGYFYAEPYRQMGYNVLVIDNRGHGLSDGIINSVGFKEHKDVIKWAEYLHNEKGMKSVFIHGVCIGGSTALFACVSPLCPDYVVGMAAEGLYKTFAEIFKNHMIDDGHPVFPLFYGAMCMPLLFSGANVFADGPLKRIDRMEKPILFLHSELDKYSLPKDIKVIYNKCKSEKQLVWFQAGGHSKIRINNREKYDETVKQFLTRFNN